MMSAIEAYTALARRFDICIPSTAPWENASAWRDKFGWVKTYLGANAYKRLILTSEESECRRLSDRRQNQEPPR